MIRRLLLPLALVPALALAACGDDDNKDDTLASTLLGGGSTPDLTAPGGGTIPGAATIPGDVTVPGSIPQIDRSTLENAIREALPNLRDEQVACVADSFTGAATDLDISELSAALQSCGVDPSQIGG